MRICHSGETDWREGIHFPAAQSLLKGRHLLWWLELKTSKENFGDRWLLLHYWHFRFEPITERPSKIWSPLYCFLNWFRFRSVYPCSSGCLWFPSPPTTALTVRYYSRWYMLRSISKWRPSKGRCSEQGGARAPHYTQMSRERQNLPRCDSKWEAAAGGFWVPDPPGLHRKTLPQT